MQKMMGLVRRCIEDYNMIEAGDCVAVGVSGGKDSLTLLVVLAAVCLVLGLFPDRLTALFQSLAAQVL